MSATILTWVPDIFFLAKIQETAKAAGVSVVMSDARRGVASVVEACPQAIILDLNSCGASAMEWIRELKSDPATRPIPIVGFVSHVQEQTIAEARAAGCDKVMARSAFTQQLPGILKGLANPGNS